MKPPDLPKQRSRNQLARLLTRTVVGAGAVILAIGFTVILVKTTPELVPTESNAEVRVQVVAAGERPVRRLWLGYGVAAAMNEADLAAQVGGRVHERPTEIEGGAPIAIDDLIVQIERDDYADRFASSQRQAAALDAQIEGLDVEADRLDDQIAFADEQVRLAQEEESRMKVAGGLGGTSEIEMIRIQQEIARLQETRASWQRTRALIPTRRLQLQAELSSRQQDIRMAERDLDRTRITSPIHGFIQRVHVEQGEFVSVGSPIGRVVDISELEIPIRIAASAFGRIKINDEVELRSTSGDGRRWQGRVSRIAPEVDQSTRSMTVFVEVTQNVPDGVALGSLGPEYLLPGRFVTARLTGSGDEPQMIVPRRAVRNDRVYVARPADEQWTVEGRGITVLYHVEGKYSDLSPNDTQWAVIGSGLLDGELVITSNLEELDQGMVIGVSQAGR